MNVKKSCQGCKHWSPVDPSLDNGWRIFGTCQQMKQHASVFTAVRHRTGYDDDATRVELKKRLHDEMACVQSSEGDTAYLRCSMDFYCALFESKDRAPKEPSMTGKE